nr:MAG TPA: hypothetical protein [Caudoviricetes sp.]
MTLKKFLRNDHQALRLTPWGFCVWGIAKISPVARRRKIKPLVMVWFFIWEYILLMQILRE